MADLDFNGWIYDGDVGIRHGGFYWKRRSEDSTEVDIVQVHPLSDEGGPDNMFRIMVGIVDLADERIGEARISAGMPADHDDIHVDVRALIGYSGFADMDENYLIRIGRKDDLWVGRGEQPEPDLVLNGNASLRNWIKREYLHPDEPSSSSSMGMR
jgi:hypothetical protein